MAENVKGLAMRYKHDGVVYELDSGKLVHTKGEQSIDGKKVFKVLPQSEAVPTAEHELVNKAYVDSVTGGGGPKDVSFTVSAVQTSNSSTHHWTAVTKLQIFLANGKRLDPLYMEEGNLKNSKEPKLLVLTVNTQEAVNPKPTKIAKSAILKHELKAGEYLGLLYPSDMIGDYTTHATLDYQDPWEWYYTERKDTNYHEPGPQYKIEVFGLPCIIKKIGVNTDSGYATGNVTVSCTIGSMTKDGTTTTIPGKTWGFEFSDELANAVLEGIPVFTTKDQFVSGVKTFTQTPKSASAPIADEDLVNKQYVDSNFISSADFPSSPNTVTGLVKGSNKGGSYCGFSYFKWLLKDGTRLDLKMVENVTANNATTPVLAVWHVVKDLGAQITAPEKKSKAEIEGYQLQEGEFKGTLSYFKVVGKYNVYTGEPWDSYIGSGIIDQHEGLLGFAINDLVSPLKAIEFTVGNKGESWQYAFDTLQVTGKNGSKDYDVTYPKKAVNNEVVTVELPFSSVPDFVTVQNEQTITGVKNFDALPVSKVKPTEDNQLTNKKYVDSVLGGGYDVGVTISQAYDTAHTAWGGVSKLHLKLASGVLEAKYVEETMPADAKEPALVVWVLRNEPTNNPTVEYKSKEELKAYELQDDEFFGDITYANLLGPYKSHTSTSWRCPFDTYLYNGGALGQQPIIRVNVNELNQAVKSVCYYSGHDGAAYVAKDDAVEFVVNKVQSDSTVTGTGTDTPFNFSPKVTTLFDSKKYKFVPIEGDANIFDVKTFSKSPKCLADAVDDNDLVTKAYVDASFSPYAPQDWSVQISFGYISGSFAQPDYTAFSYLKPLLVGGGRLEIKAVSSSISYIATDPINVIWKINPDADAPFTEPQSMTDTNIKSYVLQKGEFRGTIIFAKHYGEATTHSTLYKPWQCYAAKAKSSEQIIFGFTVEGLTVGLKAITFLMGDCRPENNNGGDSSTNKFWAYHTYMKAVSNNVEQVLDFRNNHGYAITQTTKQTLVLDPHKSLPYISFNQAQKELVTIGTEQTVKAVKTFDKFPKVTSASGNLVSTKEELVHRDYIDNNVPPALRTNTIALRVFQPRAITRGQSFSLENIKLVLKNGQCITPFIVDSAGMRDPTNPCPVIWKLVAYSEAVAAPSYKTADEINATKLSAGMYKGSYYPMKRLWNSTGSNASFAFNLFGGAASDGAGNGCDVFKVDIYGLDIPVDRIEFSRHFSSGQIGSLTLLISVDGGTEQRCNYTPKELLSDGQIKESDYVIPVKINNYWKLPLGAGYTTLSSDQTIDGFKSFAKSVSCEVAPTEDAHLANKKYVDDELAKLVARIAALEAAKP